MKALVPIKRVVDPYAKVRPQADGLSLNTSGVKFDINPFDEIAVEEAVRQRENGAITEIIAVSIGSGDSEEQLRKALAMGADRAILLETDADLDPRNVSQLLAGIVNEERPDVVILGKQSTDDDGNQVGQMLAARLDWPIATFASKVEFAAGSATVERETDLGVETVSLPLPAVITTDLRLNEPRYIALPGIIKARSKPLERRAASDVPPAQVRITHYELPPERAAGRRVGSVSELVGALRERGVVK